MTRHGHGARGRLSRRREAWVHLVLGLLWASGAAWLVCRWFLRPSGPFGEMPHPLEAWWMRLHGLAAFASLWLAGQLWIVHVVPAWRSERRLSGILLAAAFAFLIATGYLLYYAGGDSSRALIADAHWIVGLALVALLLVHAFHRRAKRRARTGLARAASIAAGEPARRGPRRK